MATAIPSPWPLRLAQGPLPLGHRGTGVGYSAATMRGVRPSRGWGQVNSGRLRAASPDAQTPASEPPDQEAEAAEQQGEAPTPLGSWAETAAGDKWEAGLQQRSSYALFAVGIAAVAVASAVLQRQYGAFRRSRRLAAAAAVSTLAAQQAGQGDEGGPVAVLQAPHPTSSVYEGSQEGSNGSSVAEESVGQAHDVDGAREVVAVAHESQDSTMQHPNEQQQQQVGEEQQAEPAHGHKRPMRTPEGEAVLARIRAAQEERKAHQRAPKAAPAEGNGGVASSTRAAALDATAGKAEGQAREDQGGSSTSSAAAGQGADGEGSGEEQPASEVAIPEGMDLDAVRHRAAAASRAAIASAAAAHNAATASALAAGASQRAAHFAQQAAAAATRAQAALNLKAADAIEAAYGQAAEAEKHAGTAAAASTSQAGRATNAEKKAAHQARRGREAADLSSPHGVVEKASAAVRQSRRAVMEAATTAADTASSASRLLKKEAVGMYTSLKSILLWVVSQLHRLWAGVCQLWARASAGGCALFEQARERLGAK